MHDSEYIYMSKCVPNGPKWILDIGKNSTDVTLACEDKQKIDAHKVILAASSPNCQQTEL